MPESAGNALRDISRTHFPLVLAALRQGIAARPEAGSRRTITRIALKNAVNEDPTLHAVYEGSNAVARQRTFV